jgi:hypothetical protein
MKAKLVRPALLGLVAMTFLLAPSTAFSWGAATHAYIADHIGKKDPLRNGIEIMETGLDDQGEYALALEVAHNIVEYAVDILVRKELDPKIGAKIGSAALCRPPTVPLLLVRAYADEMARYTDRPAITIIKAEREFRLMMVLYGHALSQNPDVAVSLVADQLASLSADFLESYGINPPPVDQLTPLITAWISQAMQLCAPNYAGTINWTIDFVKVSLENEGVTYRECGLRTKLRK